MSKKRSHHKIAIFLILVIIVQISFISQGSAKSPKLKNNLDSNSYVTEQKDALDAYNIIIERLKTGELNEDIYAGAYIDGTKLIIMLTNTTDNIKNEFMSVVENPYVIDFEEARYSIKYLNEQLNETVNALSDYPITEFGLYESKNKGFIRIEKDYYDSFVDKMPTLYSKYDIPIIFEPGEYYDMNTTMRNESESLSDSEIISDESYSANAVKDIRGGMNIDTSIGYATIGFCGYYGIMDAIITAGHAVSEGERTEYGSVVQRKYGNNQYGDFAIIFVDSDYKITNEICHSYWGSLSVRTVYSNVPVGTSLTAYGDKGKEIPAKVTGTNVTKTTSDTGITIHGLTQTKCDWKVVRAGDSGGPVFVSLGNYQVAACGIIQGGNNYDEMCFVPFEHIASAFSPKTSP